MNFISFDTTHQYLRFPSFDFNVSPLLNPSFFFCQLWDLLFIILSLVIYVLSIDGCHII